jgi:hypothetical protein
MYREFEFQTGFEIIPHFLKTWGNLEPINMIGGTVIIPWFVSSFTGVILYGTGTYLTTPILHLATTPPSLKVGDTKKTNSLIIGRTHTHMGTQSEVQKGPSVRYGLEWKIGLYSDKDFIMSPDADFGFTVSSDSILSFLSVFIGFYIF